MAPSSRRATLTTQIADELRNDIIAGAFAPGQRLTTAELTVRYQVSATPLREALQHLAAQGMVDIDPRLGTSVPPISRAHLRDTYAVRELLEVEAVKRSIENADTAWAARLGELFVEFQEAVNKSGKESGVLSWSAAHRAFHEGLMANCDSPWLKSLINMITDHSERYRMLSARLGVRDPIAEHHAIYQAAISRDAEAAAEALREHLRLTVKVLEESLPVTDDTNDAGDGVPSSTDDGLDEALPGDRSLPA